MIYRLRGDYCGAIPSGVLIDVGGVGYQVLCGERTSARLTEDTAVTLWIYTQARDDGMYLYGFSSWQEREFFVELLGIGGVGGKVALAIMDKLTIAEIIRAAADEYRIFATVQGVGERTAKKLAMEIEHRKKKFQALIPLQVEVPAGRERYAEATSALLNMGFGERQVRAVLAELERGERSEVERNETTAEIVRRALTKLAHRPRIERELSV